MRLALALIVLPALPATAAIQPCYLDQAVAEAVTVVQVTDHEVTSPDSDGLCTLTGIVARSFRGDLEPGATFQSTFACENPDGLVGGTTYHSSEAVAGAAAVEIHATADGRPEGDGWGLLLLEEVTMEPAFPFEHIDEC